MGCGNIAQDVSIDRTSSADAAVVWYDGKASMDGYLCADGISVLSAATMAGSFGCCLKKNSYNIL